MSIKSSKNLIFASASFHPWDRSFVKFKKKDLKKRENFYWICLEQLLRVVPEDFEIVLVENTINNTQDLFSESLADCLNKMNVLFLPDVYKKKSPNIGVSELVQLIYLYDQIGFEDYSKVCYFSSRRFITSPYVFERTLALKKNALVSNPNFIHLNGEIQKTEKKGMFNDMFFSMTSRTMKEYVSFSRTRLDYLENNMINSESNLYDFIINHNISYEELPNLGFLLYDYYNKSKDEFKKYSFV